jgi:isoquinoline 1-oxidoreductase beta subunit
MTQTFQQSRRDFLKAGALTGTALVIGFTLPVTGRRAQAAGDFAPNAFLRVDADGNVTVICGLSEMGQGVLTAIPMLVAEELDADWTRVAVEQAPADAAYINPIFGFQGTGGSTSVMGHWEPMRKAGAAAREMLVAAAAARWGVAAGECGTEPGAVTGPGGRRAAYGELVADAATLPVPAEPKLKDPRDFRLLGQPLPRLDSPPKVDGSGQFGLDVRLPGMLTAVMARPPAPGAKLVKVDDSKARAVPGVRDVIQIPQGVAVLADGYWPALTGRDELVIEWDKGGFAGVSTDSVSKRLHDALGREAAVARSEGDVSVAAARHVEATYEVPYLAHACMEPMNCTAWVKADEAEVWAGTQGQGPHQGAVAGLTGLPPEKVKIHTTYLGGGFGRRFAGDFVVAATLLSKQAGKPVKLVYTREDDTRAMFFRPASVARFRAGLDEAGQPVSFSAKVACPSVLIAAGFATELPKGVDSPAVEGIEEFFYGVPNVRVEYVREEPGYQVWFWRSVGHSQNCFFLESFVDEMAHAAGQDPYRFRRALLAEQPRQRGVLDLAAEKAGWGDPLPSGVHRGIALTHSFGSYVAEVAEVSVGADGQPTVHRVVAAVDCGHVVNPQIIRRQIESAIVYGLSAAFHGRIDLKDGEVVQGNFDDYPVMRMRDMPKVEVHIVPSAEKPSGIGEPGLPPAAPAVCNAIFAATGKRVRKLPIDVALLAAKAG